MEKGFELFVEDSKSRVNGNDSKTMPTVALGCVLFKTVFRCETYATKNLPIINRSAIAKFRSGVAPIGLGTGQHE